MKKIVKCILPIVSSAALVTPVLVSCGNKNVIKLSTYDFIDGVEMLYSDELNITAGSTFWFSADFRKWNTGNKPSCLEFFNIYEGQLQHSDLPFTVEKMYKNGQLVGENLWHNKGAFVLLEPEFAQDILQSKPTITGILTLGEQDAVGDMLAFQYDLTSF